MRKRLLVGASLVVLLLAGLGAIYGYQVRAKRSAKEALTEAATRLSDCLVGDATGDMAEALEHEALGARASLAPDESDTRWPKRCLAYLDPIEGAARRARSLGIEVGGLPIAEVRHDLAAAWIVRETKEPDVAELLGALEDFRHGAHDRTVPKAPKPAVPAVGSTSLVPLGGNVAEIDREKHGARFDLDGDKGMILCEYDATLAKARCRGAPESPLFLSAEIGARWVFANGNQVYDEKGASLFAVPHAAEVSHVRSFEDGRIAAMDLTWSVQEQTCATMALSLLGSDGRFVRSPLQEELAGVYPRFAGSYVVWKGPSSVSPRTDPWALRARSIVDVLAPAVTIGPVVRRAGTDVRTDGTCEADAVFFDMSPSLAAVDADGRWHLLHQEPLEWSTRPDRMMSCEGERLQIVDTDASTVKLQQCDARKGCTRTSAPVALPYEAKVIATGANVLVLWADQTEGAVYFMRAPLADLAKAEVRALVHTGVARDAVLTMLLCEEMAAFGEDVLVLMRGTVDRRSVSTYGFVIHADGTAFSLTPD